MADITDVLQEYVATANNPEYGSDWGVINSKFPELKDFDPGLLQEYVATANNPDYGTNWNIINGKFPEFQQQQGDFPADEEVKGDPSQEDVTVEGEDGASDSGDTSSESQETEVEEPKINTGIDREAKYTLDDLVDLKDDQFAKEFSNSGIEVKELGVMMGNAVNVTLPGEDPIYIDLKPFTDKGTEEAKEKIQRVLDYQNSLSDETKKTIGVLASDDDYGNISQDALDVFGESGYEITRTVQGQPEYSGIDAPRPEQQAQYNIEFGGEVVFTGTNSQLKKYFIENPLDETQSQEIQKKQYAKAVELNNAASEKAKKEIEGITKEANSREYYEKNLANDVYENFQSINSEVDFGGLWTSKNDASAYGFDSYLKEYFSNEDDNKVINDKVTKFSPEQLLRDYHKSLANDPMNSIPVKEEEYVERYLPQLTEAWGNVYEEPEYDENGDQLNGGLDKKIAKYAIDKKASITNTYLEKEMENSGLQNVVRSSIYSTSLELEKTKDDLEKATEYFKPSFDKKQEELQVDVDNIIASAGGDGVTNIEYNQVGDNDGYYIVTANSPEVQADYQARLNKISKRSGIIARDFETTRNNLNTKWNEYYSSLDDPSLQLKSAADRDYDFVNILSNDVGHSFENMLLDVPILFGNDAALQRKNQNQDYDTAHLETMQTYNEAWNRDNFLFNMTRTMGQQSAPIASAILGAYGATAAFGTVRGATIAQNVIPGFYGVTSAGSKKGELQTLEDYAVEAEIQLKELLKNEDKLDPDVFRESKIALERTIADGTMDPLKKWVTIVGTGVIEGTVTRFLGTVPNALKMVDDFANPLDDLLIAGTKNGYQNAARGLGKFVYRTGMEVAEEELIYLGSMGLESAMLNKDFDWSQIDDVAVAAIMVAGPMNGPGIAYSTIAQHNATRDMYSRNTSIQEELKRIDNDFGNLDPNKKGYQNQRDQLAEERQEQMDKLYGLTSELELNAMLTGGENVGKLVMVGNQLNQLNKQANIDPTLSPEDQEIQSHIYSLSLGKAEGKKFRSEYDTALKAKNKILNSVSYTNAVERLYGDKGKKIKDKLLKKDPELAKDPKALAVAVHQEIKNQLQKNKAALARQDDGVLEYVERQIYDGKTFKESGRKKRNRKKEDEFLARISDQLGITSKNTGLIVNNNENVNAALVLQDKKLEDLDLKVAETDEDLQTNILNAYDDVKNKEIDEVNRRKDLNKEQKQEEIDFIEAKYDYQAEAMIDELRMGETNGAIIGSKYIVKDKKAALGEIQNGNILAGTVLSHEISHAVDQLTFANMKEMLTYAKGLHGYMSENHKDIHDAAMLRMRFVGGEAQYNPEVELESQTSQFWDEYTKSVQDILKRPRYSSEVRQILNEGQATGNKFRAMFNGDYKINNGRDAAVYMASYIDNFKQGKLGELQKRRIDPAKKRAEKEAKQEGLKEAKKSANIKSPLLYDQANEAGKKVNNLYNAKDSNPNWKNDIAQLYDSMLGKYLTNLENKGVNLGRVDDYGNVSQEDKRNNIADFKSNAMYGNRGIIDVIDSFKDGEMVDVVDPKTGEITQEENTISKYINGLFPQRLSEFLKDTTIDFTGFKVDVSKAENIVTTETDQAINDILTPEVQDQLNTPFLNNVELTKEQVTALRDALTSIVGRELPDLNTAASKNRSVSPLIAALKKEFGVKNGPIHRLIQDIMGANKAELEAYLRNPKNKRAMLQTLTTTWLSKNLPKAVEKKIVGKGWTTEHEGAKKGKKPGDIVAWLSSEDGPYKGMTDGKQKIRRNPKANEQVTPAMLLSNFARGEKMTDIRRAGLEKLQLALAQELGLEVFKADMINDGDLKDLFVGRQDLFDRVLANNFVEEFVRQTERGITKRSGNYNLSAGLQMDFGSELVDLAIKHGYGTLEFEAAILKSGIPQEFAISFEESGLADMFSKDSPKYKERLEGLLKDKKLKPETKEIIKEYLALGAFAQADKNKGNIAREKSAKSMKKLVEELPLEIFLSPAVTKGFFGFDSSYRGFDTNAKGKREYSKEAENAMRELGDLIDSKIEEAKQALKDGKIKTGKLGFDPSKTRTINAGVGLMSKIQKILSLDIKADEKKARVKEEYKDEIEGANQNNPKLLAYIQNKFLELAMKDKSMMIGMLYYNQMATSNTAGQRALSTLELIQYQDGSQGLWIAEVERGRGKNKKVQTEYFFSKGSVAKGAKNIRPNISHPDYNAARVIAEDRVKKYQEQGLLEDTPQALEEELIYMLFGGKGVKNYQGGLLRQKGEHVTPSAGELGKISVEAIKAFDKKDMGNFNDVANEIAAEFEQSLGTEALSFVQDQILGTTSELGSARIISLLDQQFVDINSFETLNGQSAQDRMNDKFFNKENIKEIKRRLKIATPQQIDKEKRLDKAVFVARKSQNPSRGITVLDFDDTLATSKSLVISTSPDGIVRKLTAEEFAQEGADLLDQGWTHDFSEFSKVVDGKVASLFKKAMKLQGKFGPENMFVLTARPADSAPAIFEFLKANGLNIPLENITGLANSTSEAKALWIADKVAEGYNDFYFADDALQNVQAVQNMLDQFDVKSKVQQAKRSANVSVEFNDILEATTGIESEKEFSDAQAKLRGQKTKYKSIIPASAQDFQGLLYNFLGKGAKGEADMAFFKEKLIDPFARGVNELNSSRQAAANDFENLNKKLPKVKKQLNKNIEGLDYTYDQAMRVYLWNKAGFEVPGLSKRDLAALTSVVQNNPELQTYADTIGLISKKDGGYSQPKDYWLAESIASDLLSDGAIGDKRSDFLADWIENKNMIFSPENLNKIEAIYGSKFREALEDMLYRMETGRNRPMGGGRLVNAFMNWTNNSVGAIMFLNLRSATLQTISAVNYVNWDDNNPAKAAAAFANQPQFWRDFSYIFNSDYLKQRRSGNQRGVNEAELSEAVAGSDNKAKAAIAWLLKKGFTPTQIADSFAISMGGATFYRNRIKKYVKEGMTTEQAEKQAFLDLQETTEVNQQSARPDMISQQQASPLGRLILAFQNTPMQYARIMNKATRDLVNGRGDYRAHISKIVYYGFVQSIIFGALQSALYASLGDDDEEDFGRKKERILNQMVDSWLTGIGYGGKAIGTIKNTLMEYFKQRDKGFNSDHAYTLLTLLSFSPPIGSKLRKIYSSIQTEQFNRGVFTKRGFTLDNPIWSGVGNVVEGLTNIPLGRISNLMLQLDNAMDPAHKWWQRVALLLGQNTWDLGIKDPDIEAAKDEVKEEKKIESKKRAKIKKEKKKKEKEEENKAVIEGNKKKSKKDGICSAVSKGGQRCKTKVVAGKLFCTVHESTTKRSDGKEVQCRKRKSDGKRCKMKTTNKSGYCYYHD